MLNIFVEKCLNDSMNKQKKSSVVLEGKMKCNSRKIVEKKKKEKVIEDFHKHLS